MPHLAKSVEQRILTLGSLCLPCHWRYTAWIRVLYVVSDSALILCNLIFLILLKYYKFLFGFLYPYFELLNMNLFSTKQLYIKKYLRQHKLLNKIHFPGFIIANINNETVALDEVRLDTHCEFAYPSPLSVKFFLSITTST